MQQQCSSSSSDVSASTASIAGHRSSSGGATFAVDLLKSAAGANSYLPIYLELSADGIALQRQVPHRVAAACRPETRVPSPPPCPPTDRRPRAHSQLWF